MHQPSAFRKCVAAQCCQALRKRYICQRHTLVKRMLPYAQKPVLESHIFQIRTACKRPVFDCCHRLRDYHIAKAQIVLKYIVANRNDRMSVNRLRDRKRRYRTTEAGDGRIAIIIQLIFINRYVLDGAAAANVEVLRTDRRKVGAKLPSCIASAGWDPFPVFIVRYRANRAVRAIPNVERIRPGFAPVQERNACGIADFCVQPGVDSKTQIRQFWL